VSSIGDPTSEQSVRATFCGAIPDRHKTSLVAPHLFALEVANILRQRMRTSYGLSLVQATQHLDDFLALQIEFCNPVGLHYLPLVLTDALGLPTTYDAHYLALAVHLGCKL
jgi:predicted nucleic acid-binding protein